MERVNSTLESVVESADRAEEEVLQFGARMGFDESELYFVGLAVREMVVNAAKHGNQFDPKKKVGFRLSGEDGQLTIEITDEGRGFRLEAVPDPRAVEYRERTSGRGIALAIGMMDEFHVEPNTPTGSRIRMSKKLVPAAKPESESACAAEAIE